MGRHGRTAVDHRLTGRGRTGRWWRLLGAAATALALFAMQLTPAYAAWPEEWWFTDLDVQHAWTISKGAGVTVAVVDSGVVPIGDLGGRVLPGVDLSGGDNARSDPGEGCSQAGGCYSHGTQMALLIAGTGAGKGFEGIAPQARILPVKVSPSTSVDAETPTVARGIRWAVDHGAQIVNVSLGGAGSCPPAEAAAVKYAYQHNVLVVAGSGNEGVAQLARTASCPGALAIGAVDKNFDRASFSNYGPQLDFVMPGTPNVQETLSGAKLPGGPGSGGTSDATAIASGVFALIRSHFPHASARDIVTHALWNVHNGLGHFGVRINDQLGYGEILPYHAMHDPLPPNATNPIYAAWAKTLGAPTPSAGKSTGPARSDDASPSESGPSSSDAAGLPAHASGGGGIGAGAIIGIVVAVVVVALIAGWLLVRRRTGGRAHSGGPPPPVGP